MNTEHTNQSRQAETVNQQLLALVKSFGHKTGCAKNAFGEQCTCGADEAIAAAEQAQAEPVAWKPGKRQPSVFKTSEAGRQYVADFFANALRRHDFYSYIKGHLAADFACALSDGLHAMQTVQQQAEPVAWEYREFHDDNTVTPGWGKWKRIESEEWAGRAIKSVVADIHEFIAQGYRYELRALYAQPPAVADTTPLTDAQIDRHTITAGECPAASKVMLVSSIRRLLARGDNFMQQPAVAVPDGYALVPVEPTEEQWGGLARDIIMAFDLGGKSPASLLANMRLKWGELPEWMRKELHDPESNAVLSKGTRAVLIYRAMLAAAQKGGA